MARNLVQERKDDETTAAKTPTEKKPEAAKPVEEKVVYITTEQVTLNNLNVIMAQLELLYTKMLEGFKQVGVKFEESKDK